MGERAQQIVDAALDLLESEGREAMSMRGIAERVGIRAPSLYKHFPDKAAVEIALITVGFEAAAEALEVAEARDASVTSVALAYRRFALSRPHLYRLTTTQPLPREALPEGLEARAAGPITRVVGGDPDLARAAWAFTHGMIMLELDGRFPRGANLDGAWQAGCDAFAGRVARGATGEVAAAKSTRE
ncbi:TetR/AcrR family transcriptional regulator [Yinghuangia sp. YIM S09857]|uniref:TetR/AcrR family transcriptional regulator n=1 Tax=Yinghuangia sp. YIM S09857 TaxID=3436929 RepID=UPI003F538D04